MIRHLLDWPGFLVLALLVQGYECVVGFAADPRGFLQGDSGLYAAAAHSLLYDGDLDLLNQCRPNAATLEDALPELQGDIGGEFALSADRRITLKQSPLLAVLAVPFYAVLGFGGFLVFNLIVLNLLLVGLAVLAGNTSATRIVVLLGFTLTPLRQYTFNFSPDLLLCALFVGGILAARSARPGWAGALCGLAMTLKLYAAALALPIPLLALGTARWRSGRTVGWLLAGGFAGLLPGFAFNLWQFGSPTVTGYERQLKVTGSEVGLADHSSRFTVPLGDGVRELVFDPELGLWPRTAIWFAWPVAAGLLLTRRFAPPTGRGWVLATVAIIVLNLGVFAKYDGALIGSRFGNRYLFPAVTLGIALIAAAVSTRCHSSPTSKNPESNAT